MDINTEEIKKKLLEKTESVKKTVEEKAGRTLPWTKIAAALVGVVLVAGVAAGVGGGKTSSFLREFEKIVVKAEKFAKKGDIKSFEALNNDVEKLAKDMEDIDFNFSDLSDRKKRKAEKLYERLEDAASKIDELSSSKKSSSSKKTTKQTLSPKKVPAYLKVEDREDGTWIVGYNASGFPENLKIPNGIVGIEKGAFRNCLLLESVEIPKSVKYVDGFESCEMLERVTLANGVETIGDRAFFYCASLTNITIPKSVKEIKGDAFSSCTSLKSIEIPDSVERIGSFYGCTSLESIVIPDSQESIDISAFSSCTSLKSVKIGGGVTSINLYAFQGCKSLESVSIPKGVTYIGSGAFKDCTSLKDVRYENTTKRWKLIRKEYNYGGGYTSFDKGVIVKCSDGDVAWDAQD